MKLYETSFVEKKISIVLLFHVAAFLFMSARPILGHSLPIFDGFSSELPGIANFLLKIMIFYHFGYLSTFLVQNFVRRATFNFQPILADFHEYTLNMTSYHVTEAINSYF